MPTASFSRDCTLCMGDLDSAMGEKASPQAPVCLDPHCPESVCDECQDHDEDCCQECVQDGGCEDCPGHQDYCEGCDEHDCGQFDPIDCAIPHCEYHKDYVCDGSCFELFGDQAAEMFGHGALPELPMEMASSNTLPRLQSPMTWGSSSSTGYQPMAPPFLHESSYEALRESAGILMQAAAATNMGASHDKGDEDPVQVPTGLGEDMARKQKGLGYFHPEVQGPGNSISRSPTYRLVVCQWANEKGEPCGEVSGLGDELHEHLKVAHNIKNEVYCRWLGCRVGNHRYANGVQRHTWGHSGYRPYKCPECSEGFAAAAVREEHIANIHMKKKIFACDVCNHQCTSATNLKRHKDEKHRAERFQCEFCNSYGKRTLFPRGPNLARHFRKCKYVLAQFPDASGATDGKISDDWFPPGYKRGHHGMNRAKITPPNYLPLP